MNNKEYKIPDYILGLWDKYKECEELAVDYVFLKKGYWNYRKAVKLRKKAERFKNKFWKKTRKLYPELNYKTLYFNFNEQAVYIKDEMEEEDENN